MDGWETARRLRRSLPERTAIVVLSANAIDPSRLVDGERLHDEYLMKPIDLRQLLKTIHVLLNIEWIYDTPDKAAAPSPPTTSQLRLPPGDDIDELINLGEIGHVRRIQEKLNEIEHTAAEYSGFVAPLRAFISAFDLKRYLATLEAMRSGHA
jgi:response regulator RpfG family c-di-GMP phosphodiesterase